VARTVVLDVAGQAALARDLAAGGVLVPDLLEMNEDVELILRAGDEEVRCAAKCVWVNGDKGSGLQLLNCDGEMKHRIAGLAGVGPQLAFSAPKQSSGVGPRPGTGHDGGDGPTEDTNTELTDQASPAPADPDESVEDPATEDAVNDAATDDAETDEPQSEGERKIARNLHERVRGLALAQQIKMAGTGELAERIVLERMYGKNVWEALLRNPRLTGPEVARIARMGSLPRPLMEIILANGGWLQIPEVRRALLTNPRLATDQIMRILRLLPKHELKLAAMQTAYPFSVRDVAKRLLKEAAGG
jgi:hypothetical protein